MNLSQQYDKIYRYCFFHTRCQELAEDLTQETFLRYYQHPQYQSTGKELQYLAEERELILLRYVNEVPVVVMSQLYGISRFALHRKLKAILAKLRKHFGKEADGYETEI